VARVEGSALVAQAMQREGIEVLFGLAGGPIQDIMGWAPHCGVRPIGVRHEQAATFAAAAYGYVKNQVGVAVLAAGPGVTNGVTGAHVGYLCPTPENVKSAASGSPHGPAYLVHAGRQCPGEVYLKLTSDRKPQACQNRVRMAIH
jgi:hypothetical protein